MKFKVDKKVFELIPNLVEVVVIIYDFDNQKSDSDSIELLRSQEKRLIEKIGSESLTDKAEIKIYRDAFSKFGADPTKFNPSHFALAKRVLGKESIPNINPMVNIYNSCSIKYLVPFGGENLDSVYEDLTLTRAEGDEKWIAIGEQKSKSPLKGEFIWIDKKDVTCRAWNWRQCDRTKLTNASSCGYFIVDGFEENRENITSAVVDFLSTATKLLGGRGEIYWLDKKNTEIEIDFESKDIEDDKLEIKEKLIKKSVKTSLQQTIIDLIKKASGVEGEIRLEHPADRKFGDYSTNVAMEIANRQKQSHLGGQVNPREMAEKIKDEILKQVQDDEQSIIEKVEVAGAGFINIYLSKTYLKEAAEKINFEVEYKNYLSKYGQGKTMVIDYSAPNIAKPFGIGHLRSTNIGQALYNIYKLLGWHCIGDNHLGDWGTQFGKLMVAIKRYLNGDIRFMIYDKNDKKELKDFSVSDLEKLYVKFHSEAEKDEKLDDEGREMFAKLEQGDKDARSLWQNCVDISIVEFDRVYQLLGVKIDYTHGESFYESMLSEIISELKEKNIAKESQGALIVENQGMPPAMIKKSNQTTTYFTRDLATIKYRIENWKPDLVIYEVGADQQLHFQQLFATAEKLGWRPSEGFVHVAHGLIRWKTGKFSTRKGDTIHLSEVVEGALAKAKEIAQHTQVVKNLTATERDEMIEAVAIGAVKFNDLSSDPRKDVIFDWEQMMSLEGDSGPYLQYTYARCKSVLLKTKILEQKDIEDLPKVLTPEEENLLRIYYLFEEKVVDAATTFNPAIMANYLLETARAYNEFYAKNRIVGDQNEIFRVFLTRTTASVISLGLEILGIKTIEKM